jgi:glycosyltransferase involved in cell wall biosynthesis
MASLLRELPALAADLRLVAVTRHPDLVPAGVEPVALDARSQIIRMSLGMPRLLRRLRPRVAHFQYALPPFAPAASVVTVHDVSFALGPQMMGARDRAIFRLVVPRALRKAARVLTGSEWTRRELVARYGLPEAKVVVAPYGVDSSFSPEGERAGGEPYVLFVGSLESRKDPATALEALALVDGDLRLVLAGPAKHGVEDLRRAVRALGIEHRVAFRGYVDQSQLAALYRGAACLVLPSLYEGFGLPVIEAMASGTPVVTTTAGALPEVAGDAAVLVEPGNAGALADGIERALTDAVRLRAAGLERVKRYRWEETARITLGVYRDLL